MKNNKNSILLATIIVLLIIIIGGVMYFVGKNNLQQINNNLPVSTEINSTTSPSDSTTNNSNQIVDTTSISTSTNTNSSNQIYKDPKFGFQFTIPEYIIDYKIIATSSNEGLPIIHFWVPAEPEDPCNSSNTDSVYIDKNTQKCYMERFKIYAITKSDYNNIINECKTRSNPLCPVEGKQYLELNGYVYTYSNSQTFMGIYTGNYPDEIFKSLK